MSKIEKNLPLRAALLGAMCGMRSMSGPAIIERRATEHPGGFDRGLFALGPNKAFARLVALASVGELVVDKLPILPDRIAPLPLAARMTLGGLSAAAAYSEARRTPLVGAAIGAAAAIASAHLFYRLRVGATKGLHLPDPVVALAEDGVVLALGKTALNSYE